MSSSDALKIGYKHTPLGWIPKDWKILSLGMVINYKKGFAFKTDDYQDQGVRIIRVSDTNSGGIKEGGNIFIDNDKANLYQDYRLETDDIVIQTVGSRPPMYDSMVGKTIIVPPKFNGVLLNQNAVRVRELSGQNKYLFFLLKEKRYINYISTLIRGNANQVSITLDDLFQYQIFYPSNPLEQDKLTTILSSWDNAISQIQKLISILKQRNRGILQRIATGNFRLKKFKSNWQEIKVSDVAFEVSIKNKTDESLPVLSCTKYDGLVDSLTYFGRKIYSDDTSTYKIAPKAHFAYATNHIEEGSIGYQSLYTKALISPMYTVFKTTEKVHDDFFYKLLKSYTYIHEYKKRMEGSIDRRGGLRWDEFSKIPVYLPEYDEQVAINNILNTANDEVKLYEQKLATLQLQKKGLMQKLLTGEVRVKFN